MKTSGLLLLLLTALPAFGMKNLQHDFPDSCDVVWKAVITIAKTQDYRIITVDHEDRVVSLAGGGWLAGERLMTLSLESGQEYGCTATVQSRFSGLLHSDGPDLLARVSIEVIKGKIDPESKAFHHFTKCMAKGNAYSVRECEQRLQKDIAKEKPQQTPQLSKPASSSQVQDPDSRWWNVEETGPHPHCN